MEIGESLTIGRMGQQPLHITDASVDPQHATLRRVNHSDYQIEDLGSGKGIFVFGIRIKRKTIKGDTPIFLGSYKTSVNLLLTDLSQVDLDAVWRNYSHERQRWDRYPAIVNSARMLTPVITMLLTQVVGQNWAISAIVLVAVLMVTMIVGEKVLAKKNVAMADLNARLQTDYVCPHCQRFLGFVPYAILKQKGYCPNCGVPLK